MTIGLGQLSNDTYDHLRIGLLTRCWTQCRSEPVARTRRTVTSLAHLCWTRLLEGCRNIQLEIQLEVTKKSQDGGQNSWGHRPLEAARQIIVSRHLDDRLSDNDNRLS